MTAKGGRPTKYTEELAQRICELVATNPLGLPALCRKFPELPNQDTINVWRWEKDGFSDKYTRAKQFQAELMAESIEDVIDETLGSIYLDEHGSQRLDSGILGHARLKVDSRKWTASKLAPKIYGDRMHVSDESKSSENEALKAELIELRAKLAEQNKSEY
jgi:hypothetical protein